MKPMIITASLWLTVLLISSTGFSHEGSFEVPSASAETGSVYIANRTNDEIVFYLESANTIRTKHRLSSQSGMTFSGAAADAWFNIHVYTDNTPVIYGLNAGKRYYLKRNSAGIIDVYIMPES
ncbi:MAG: hypothetical protein ABJA60_11830 [Nitrosospira sp.]